MTTYYDFATRTAGFGCIWDNLNTSCRYYICGKLYKDTTS